MLTAHDAYLFNAPNKADRFVDILRQHRAVYSWFRDFQNTCHLNSLLIWRYLTGYTATERGKCLVFFVSFSHARPRGRGNCIVIEKHGMFFVRQTPLHKTNAPTLSTTYPLCYNIFIPGKHIKGSGRRFTTTENRTIGIISSFYTDTDRGGTSDVPS